MILWFNLYQILDFDRNNLHTYFCFFELLILREKRIADFNLDHWSTKKIKIFFKYCKNTIQENCTITLFLYSPCRLIDIHGKGRVCLYTCSQGLAQISLRSWYCYPSCVHLSYIRKIELKTKWNLFTENNFVRFRKLTNKNTTLNQR